MGVLTRPYLSADAKVTTGPPRSISHSSAAYRQYNRARACLHPRHLLTPHHQGAERHLLPALSLQRPCSPTYSFRGPKHMRDHNPHLAPSHPPANSHKTTQVLFKCISGQESWPSRGYGRVCTTITYTDQATYSSLLGALPNRKPESWTRQGQSHQTQSQPPGRSANDLPSQKRESWEKVCVENHLRQTSPISCAPSQHSWTSLLA